MFDCLKSECLKQKGRFSLNLLWLGPVTAIALALLLMRGNFLIESAFNWWYTLILPGTLSMVLSFSRSGEKKHHYHGLFSVVEEKKKLWTAHLLLQTGFLLVTNLLLFLLLSFSAWFLGIRLPLAHCFAASLTLFLSFAWQIPLWMFLSETLGSFFSILSCLFCNMVFGIFLAPTRLWLLPFAIPGRLMCPLLLVQPNNLPISPGAPLSDPSVLLPGLLLSFGLYAALSFLTSLWFARREVR